MFYLLVASSLSYLAQQFEEKSFLSWMRSTNQIFSGDEYHLRFGIYLTNLRLVQQHNSQSGRKFRIGLNKFACLTRNEYRALLGINPGEKLHHANINQKRNVEVPESLDWREKGAVCPIQDQGGCGSCWAFSAIAGAEGAWFIQTNELVKFSEQNLVDCVTECSGCGGGLRDSAYQHVIDNQQGQFMREEDYPYTAVEGDCQFDQSKGVGEIHGYYSVAVGSEDDLLESVTKYGPTSVGIDASSFNFQLYTDGIYDQSDDCLAFLINHGVVCVGFGTEDEVDYFIVRNSWGPGWGESGYVRFIRHINICGIATRAYSVY
ncbi:Cysteine proteinase 3 [Tritrichomonas foetus]|uniref:Cysteine proteinase 3 n=1 Tax=Tritrichomonas foetus TaxID=1144522 RepID=A0A1J4KR93_9EUKA|nr:Cysteine proteinase 3 [Tritrichomonas foetus]|eukprot:OHT13809.1 Cysteine proteinase 3 [Tritrichomonas foetus]